MLSSADPANLASIQEQLGAAYERFDPEQRARHAALLQALHQPQDVALDAGKRQDGTWTVTVCSCDYVGILSLIAGLFTAYRMDILNADIFTLHFPKPEVPRRAQRARPGRPRLSSAPPPSPPPNRTLDVFHVRALDATDADVWRRYRDDLAGLVALLTAGRAEAARDQVIERVSEVARSLRDGAATLFPIAIDLDNDASPLYTKLSIRSTDTLGFLFEFTNALAVLNINVERAEVRTIEGETHDTFWVTEQQGGKVHSEARLRELRAATALIKQFTHLLPLSPNPAQALRQFSLLAKRLLSRPDWTQDLSSLEAAPVLTTLAELMGVSQFLWEDFLRMQHENLFPVLLDVPALEEATSKHDLHARLLQLLASLAADEQVRALNEFKDREMFRIDLRHITHRIDFRRFADELSDLAEVVVGQAAVLSHESLQERFGRPRTADGRPCPWSICALGKFGGRELGYASDIELIFVYEGPGATDGPERVETYRYFEEFVQRFQAILPARREGIFELDLRLRPHGRAGSLATSLPAFTAYYREGGDAQQFERMALVKLRPVAGDPSLGERLQRARDAFVYSGAPLDREDILHLRHRQATELVPLGAVSAKYSHGGLVDVEYYVQAQQIAAGQRDPTIRVTNTLEAIDRLAHSAHPGEPTLSTSKGSPERREGLVEGRLSEPQATELKETYRFLRRLIDALRVVRGHARDLTIPPTDSREFAYLARRLHLDSPSDLHHILTTRMAYPASLWD